MLTGTGRVPVLGTKEILVRVKASLMTLVGVVAGVIAATVAYQNAAGAPAVPLATHAAASAASATETRTWLPCAKGWKLRAEVCVRVQQRVVVVHDRPAPVAPAPRVFAASAPVSSNATVSRSHAATVGRTVLPTPPAVHHEVETEQPNAAPASAPSSPGAGGGD